VSADVSVIIPTYNRCASLCVAIESVEQQTLKPREIIVIDDGSNDDTALVLNRDYPVAFLDSDDRWFKTKLAEQMSAISDAPVHKICHCDEHWIRNGKRVNPMNKHQKRGGFIFEHCLPLCAISPSAVIIHQSIFEDVGVFDESLPACEDYDLWLRICAKYPVLFVESALLAKTGGHDDQLSQKHWGMDRFRLQALAKLLRGGALNPEKSALAISVFRRKFDILINGASKRGNKEFATELKAQYADLI